MTTLTKTIRDDFLNLKNLFSVAASQIQHPLSAKSAQRAWERFEETFTTFYFARTGLNLNDRIRLRKKGENYDPNHLEIHSPILRSSPANIEEMEKASSPKV